MIVTNDPSIRMIKPHYSYEIQKGSSTSGNYFHTGRPGVKGGSIGTGGINAYKDRLKQKLNELERLKNRPGASIQMSNELQEVLREIGGVANKLDKINVSQAADALSNKVKEISNSPNRQDRQRRLGAAVDAAQSLYTKL